MTLYQVKRDDPARMFFWKRQRAQTFQTVQVRPSMGLFAGKAPFINATQYIDDIYRLNGKQDWVIELIFDPDAVLSNRQGRPWLDPLLFGGNYILGMQMADSWLAVSSIYEGEKLPPDFSYENYPYLVRVVTIVGMRNKITYYSEPHRGRVLVPLITKGQVYIEMNKVTRWPEEVPLEDPVYGAQPEPPAAAFAVIVIAHPHTRLMRKPSDSWLASGWKVREGTRLLVYSTFGNWGYCGERGWVRMSDVRKVD